MSYKIYMNIEGILGTVTDTHHEQWISLSSFEVANRKEVSFKVFHENMLPEDSNPEITNVVVIKQPCSASAQLFEYLNSFKPFKLTIDVVHHEHNALIEKILPSASIRYVFSTAFITEFRIHNNSEGIEMAVNSMSLSYTPPLHAHSFDKPSSWGYHFQKLRPLSEEGENKKY